MHRITSVTPGEGLTLHLTYTDGATVHADISGLLSGDPGVFAPLADRAFFEQVRPERRGRVVTWPGDLDLDADVFRLADNDPIKPPKLRILASTAPDPADPVSTAVAEAIERSGLTQTEVAQRAGMQQPNVARLIDPHYRGHSVEVLRRLAKAVGCELEVRFVPREQAS